MIDILAMLCGLVQIAELEIGIGVTLPRQWVHRPDEVYIDDEREYVLTVEALGAVRVFRWLTAVNLPLASKLW